MTSLFVELQHDHAENIDRDNQNGTPRRSARAHPQIGDAIYKPLHEKVEAGLTAEQRPRAKERSIPSADSADSDLQARIAFTAKLADELNQQDFQLDIEISVAAVAATCCNPMSAMEYECPYIGELQPTVVLPADPANEYDIDYVDGAMEMDQNEQGAEMSHLVGNFDGKEEDKQELKPDAQPIHPKRPPFYRKELPVQIFQQDEVKLRTTNRCVTIDCVRETSAVDALSGRLTYSWTLPISVNESTVAAEWNSNELIVTAKWND